MAPISKSDLDAISTVIVSSVSQAIAQAFAQQPKAAIPAQAYQYTKTSPFLPRGSKAPPSDLAAKDQRILNAFLKRGFKDTVLRDRANPDAPHNVKPFKLWLDAGRVVRKGQKGVKGLFHVDQTDPIAKPKAKAKKA